MGYVPVGNARIVSIHTRHFWRVNSELLAAYKANPRRVSIHTRHFWRVN